MYRTCNMHWHVFVGMFTDTKLVFSRRKNTFYQSGGGGETIKDYQLCNSPISGCVFAVSGDITYCLLGFIPHGFLQSLQHYKELHG